MAALGVGENDVGQLGDGAPTDPYSGRFEPVRVPGIADVVQISVRGGRNSYARKSDGTVWAWGDNSGGQVATARRRIDPRPVQVTGFRAWTRSPGATSTRSAQGRRHRLGVGRGRLRPRSDDGHTSIADAVPVARALRRGADGARASSIPSR
jgi:hypothetical protein